MTLGIDVSGANAGLDMQQARAEGVEFVIVKAAGYNTGTLYVAGSYADHVDNARAAGLAVGHYYVPGRGDVLRQADWFVDHLHDFDAARDVLALDNEPLDGNAVYWLQDDVLRFVQRVQERTGVPYSRLWLYCPADRTRKAAPWHKVTDLGVRVWWSAYGAGPTGHQPDHEPALAGSVPGWAVHQYTSRARVAGMDLDANYSRASVPELFGGATGPTPGQPAPAGAVQGRLHTSAEDDGQPGSVYYTLVQILGSQAGIYSGRIDGVPGPLTYKAETILLARLLNGLGLGRTTTADRDGNPYNGSAARFSSFVWLGQEAGYRRGWYKGARDGIDGPNSRAVRVRLLAEWLNGAA